MTDNTCTISFKSFDALTKMELYELLCLRDIVFVVGQKVTSEPEVDGLDPECVHVQVRDEADRLLATARIFEERAPIVVGRIAVHTDLQRSGIGTWMMAQVAEYLGDRPAEMHAQAHLEAWYTRCGWERYGEPFMEAEILHVHMKRG